MERILALCLGIIFAFGLTACETHQAVTTPEAKKEQTQIVEAFGMTKASEIKDILIDFPALIETINVKEGQKVKEGDILVTLNIDEHESKIRESEILLNADENEINKISNNYIDSNNGPELQKYLNDLQNAEDNYKKALKEYENKLELYKSAAIPKSETDELKNKVDARKKDIDDVKYSIDILRNNKKNEIEAKRVNILTVQNSLQLMKNKLNKSYIKNNQIISDVKNGVVYDIGYVQDGIASSDKKLFSILDLDSLIIQADVAEDFAKDVKVGADVSIIPKLDKSREYKGKVKKISNKAIQKNGETDIPVEISIDNKDDFLIADLNVDVKIKIVK